MFDHYHKWFSLGLPSTSVYEELSIPQKLNTNKGNCTSILSIHHGYNYVYYYFYLIDFTKLKDHYHTILRLMPDCYAVTVGKLQDYISFNQICVILSSNSSTDANKLILDYLIEKVNSKRELLIFCNRLESITTSHNMKSVINEIRSGWITH